MKLDAKQQSFMWIKQTMPAYPGEQERLVCSFGIGFMDLIGGGGRIALRLLSESAERVAAL